MSWLAKLIGINFGKPSMSVSHMNEVLLKSARIDQAACDAINESRRKDGLPMLRCGEGLPSWEGQLTTREPSWEGLSDVNR